MKLRDKFGWPVERIVGRPFTNFVRLLIHADIRATWRYRNWNGNDVDPGSRGTKRPGLHVKRVMRYDASQKKLRLFRLLWSRGTVGDGAGYSAKLAVSLVRRLAGWKRDGFGWRVTILGIQLHHQRAYGGHFV